VASPGHPLHDTGRALTTDDLKKHMQVVIRDSGTLKPRDDGWLGAPHRWTVTSMEASMSLVAAGLGFAWLPRHLIREHLEADRLRPLPLDKGRTRRVPLYLMFARAGEVGPAARELADLLAEVAGQRRG